MDKSPTQWMTTPLARYATFTGRARRKEYWWFWVFTLIVVAGTTVIDLLLLGADRIASFGGAGPVTGVAALALILPSLAVSIRRLHDGDKSGWFILVGLLPFVGGLILLYWYVKRGTIGDNRFGADPVT